MTSFSVAVPGSDAGARARPGYSQPLQEVADRRGGLQRRGRARGDRSCWSWRRGFAVGVVAIVDRSPASIDPTSRKKPTIIRRTSAMSRPIIGNPATCVLMAPVSASPGDRGGDGGQGRVGGECDRRRPAGVADGGRVATAEIRPDRGEAGAGERPGQVHGQVPRRDDRRPAARAAQHARAGRRTAGHRPGDRLDRRVRIGQEGLLGQDGGDGRGVEGAGPRERRRPASTRSGPPAPSRASQPSRVR